MIRWCRDRGWDYRLRLKGNLLARWGTTKTTTGGRALLSLSKGRRPRFRDCRPHRPVGHDQHRRHSRSRTCRALDHRHVGQAGISDHPGICRSLGIEPMVSDFKSRGFGLEQTHIQYPDCLARLILVMSLAFTGRSRPACGIKPTTQSPPKKRPDRQPAKLARGRLSWFTRGLRRAIKLLLKCLPLPKLWECLLN